MRFFALSVVMYGALTAWVSSQVSGTREEWGLTLAHLTLAAAINAHLLWVARRRDLSFLGSAPLAFLVVHHVYFAINGLKYFSPILLYPQFELTLGAQFAGAAAGAAVLAFCARLLLRQREPSTDRLRTWILTHSSDLRRVMLVSVAGSALCKLMLTWLGYGSTYTDSAYHEHAVRSYGDYFILLGNDTFGGISLVLGALFLMRPRLSGRLPMVVWTTAVLGILLQVAYMLLYLKARMIVLAAAITLALAAEVVSRRRAERMLQALLLLLPAVSLVGLQLTLWIGRINVPEETGLRIAIGAVNRRAELTDFAAAMIVNSRGEAYDPEIVASSVLNAIPRAVFPGKQEIVRDVYARVVEQKLGWPSGSGDAPEADYLDTVFSNGVMAFGVLGFFLLPPTLVWLLGLLSRWIGRTFHGIAYGLTLIPLWLSAMHIEGEWASIPLNLRQAILYAVICLAVAGVGRIGHEVLVVAGRSPALPLARSGMPAG